jgi:hypothetical protein
MGFRYNVFTGTLDEVNIPLIDNNNPPTMGGSGDIQTAVVGGRGRVYIEAQGQRYYIDAMADPVTIMGGQPIPIGMGLTMTYATNIN